MIYGHDKTKKGGQMKNEIQLIDPTTGSIIDDNDYTTTFVDQLDTTLIYHCKGVLWDTYVVVHPDGYQYTQRDWQQTTHASWRDVDAWMDQSGSDSILLPDGIPRSFK